MSKKEVKRKRGPKNTDPEYPEYPNSPVSTEVKRVLGLLDDISAAHKRDESFQRPDHAPESKPEQPRTLPVSISSVPNRIRENVDDSNLRLEKQSPMKEDSELRTVEPKKNKEYRKRVTNALINGLFQEYNAAFNGSKDPDIDIIVRLTFNGHRIIVPIKIVGSTEEKDEFIKKIRLGQIPTQGRHYRVMILNGNQKKEQIVSDFITSLKKFSKKKRPPENE